MILFIISILALLPGPLIYHSIRRACWARGFLDSFLLISIGGLVLMHILPFGLTHGGAPALPVFALGIVIPVLFHRYTKFERLNRFSPFLIPALIAIALHSLLDGVALREQEREAGKILAMAVVLHRLPVGLLIWWMIRPRAGTPSAIAVLVVIITATIFGYFHRSFWFSPDESTIALIQMLVAGSLVHVLYHHTPGPDFADCDHARHREAAWMGTLAAVLVLVIISLLSVSDHAEETAVMDYLLNRARLIAPPLVGATLLSFIPGFFLHRRFLESDGSPSSKRIPADAPLFRQAFALFPDTGIAAFLLAWTLFNLTMALYLTFWFALLLFLFYRLPRTGRRNGDSDPLEGGGDEDFREERFFTTSPVERGGVVGGITLLLERNPRLLYPWVVTGMVLAVLIDFVLGNHVLGGILPGEIIRGLPGEWIGMGVLLLFGFWLDMNPLATLLIAAALFENGFSIQFLPVAVLGLSWIRRRSLWILRSRLSPGGSALFFILLIFLISVAGISVSLFPPSILPSSLNPEIPNWEKGVDLISLSILGLILLQTLTRQGIREFLDQILPAQKPGDHAG